MMISKLFLFYFLTLIVFDFYFFIKLKKKDTKKSEFFKFSWKPYWNPKKFQEQNRVKIKIYIFYANFIKIGP